MIHCDALQEAGGPGIMQGTPGAWLTVCEVRAFFFNFVLHDKNKFNYITPPTDDDLLNHMIGFRQCPGQYNGIDCGLFCIAVVLHLLDGKPVTEGTFNSFLTCRWLEQNKCCDNTLFV